MNKNNQYFTLLFGILLLASCAKPLAQFDVSDTKKEAPAKIKFTNNSENAEGYVWNFGDGEKSIEGSPTHSYEESGQYEVTLKAKKGKKESVLTKTIEITAPVECLVEIKTEFGNMTVKLFNSTPKHRDNFIKLVEEGFYDDLLFHRVINGFMIQGGDPDSKNAKPRQNLGMGGPGYTVPAEFVDSLVHLKGALCAARQGDQVNPKKASSGSQFYIVDGKSVSDATLDQMEKRTGVKYTPESRVAYREVGGTPFLDRNYTVFGMVIKGLDVIDKIAKQPVGQGDRPVKNISMKMTVIK